MISSQYTFLFFGRLGLLAVWMSLCLFGPQGRAQNQVMVRLTAPSLVAEAGTPALKFRSAPYAFWQLSFRAPFVPQAFAALRKNSRQPIFFIDAQLRHPATYAATEEAIPQITQLLRKRHRREALRSPMPEEPVKVDLDAVEEWTTNAEGLPSQRSLKALAFTIESRATGAVQRLYFSAGKAPELLALLQRNHDYWAVAEIANSEVILNQLYSFELLKGLGDLAPHWQDSVASILNRGLRLPEAPALTKPRAELMFPFAYEDVRALEVLAQAQNQDTAVNLELRRQVAPVVLHALLAGNLKAWLFDNETRADAAYLHNTIAQHPGARLIPPTRENLRTQDYAFGVTGITVLGSLTKADTVVRFRPEALSLNWGEFERPTQQVQLALIRMRDLRKLRLRVQGLALEAWLARPTAYTVLYRLGDAFPATHTQAALVGRLVWEGRWNQLPSQTELQKLSEADIRRMLKGR